MSLSIYDGVMLTIVIVCVIQGAMKGMAWQLAPIASLVLGYLFGIPLSAATAPWFGEPPLNRVFSLITMYMLVSLGVYLIARSLRESIERTKLVEYDRHLGALLGGVKGVLFTTVLTVGLLCVYPPSASLIVHSESRTIADNIIDYVMPLLPPDVHKVIDPYLKPIESLPGSTPHEHSEQNFVEDGVIESTEPVHDVAHQNRETFTPRTRRHNPIFEDDALTYEEDDSFDSVPSATRPSRRRAIEEDDAMEEEPVTRRRRRAARDDTEFESADEDDNPFGDEPSQAFEEDRPSRRR